MFSQHRAFSSFRLRSRNEGKLKSYESCEDVRAWSHDLGDRAGYLKDWIRSDMPVCVMPTDTVVCFLRTMMCRHPGRVTPRCHPDCKSKMLLDSICSSCHVIRECLKNDNNFENYFLEEDLETSHWPCERCLEALKSIKMFWRIIVDRIFNLNITKKESELFEMKQCGGHESVRDVARAWKKEIIDQALFIKTNSPHRSSSTKLQMNHHCQCKVPKPIIKYASAYSVPKCGCIGDGTRVSEKSSRKKCCSGICDSTLSCKTSNTVNSSKSTKNRVTIVENLTSCKPRKRCRCTSVRVKMINMSCDTGDLANKDEEYLYKINMDCVQNNLDAQKAEIEKLRKENMSLKLQLENVCNKYKWKSPLFCPNTSIDVNNALIPTPYEGCNVESDVSGNAKKIDSEMLITMKNCKNEKYRHVSLLQVLHKTNAPLSNDLDFSEVTYKKEDPLTILAKVQNALGDIVKREIRIAKGKKQNDKQSDIDASFQSLNKSRSMLYCSSSS